MLDIVKGTKFVDFEFLMPPTHHICSYSNCYFFVCAASKWLFLYIYKKVLGASSGVAYIFLIIYHVTWFCFSEKKACWHPLHY